MNSPRANQSPPSAPPSAKPVKPSLTDQIAAAKAGGGLPAKGAAEASVKKPGKEATVPESDSKGSEIRAALVREWKELWQDRTSRIVLLGTAGAVALSVAWGAAMYSRKPAEGEKKPETVPEMAKEEVGKSEDSVTPEERYAIHRSIVEGTPYELPAKKPEPDKAPVPVTDPKPTPKPVPAEWKPEIADARKLQEKRNEIAETGQLKVSANPEDMKATVEALKEWSRQDAEAARAKSVKR